MVQGGSIWWPILKMLVNNPGGVWLLSTCVCSPLADQPIKISVFPIIKHLNGQALVNITLYIICPQ